MATFSQRYGYSKSAGIQHENIDDVLKNRIWNTFYGHEYNAYDVLDLFDCLTNIEKMMDKMGVVYIYPENTIYKQNNADLLLRYLLKADWYIIYDFIEKYLELLGEEERQEREQEYNKVLEEEVARYRIINGLVTPIIAESELEAIKEALENPYDSVSIHFTKALDLLSNRKNPDYENSIKESISAVEALCKIIIDDDNATLGKALKRLDEKGVKLHPSLRNAFENLYGYASDENGIRHAGIEFSRASFEDAKYMLVSCSAFVNYLIEKIRK